MSWLIGDPNVMVSPFVGNYKVTYTANPKCDSCIGSVCYAQSAEVTVTTVGYDGNGREYTASEVGTRTLLPAETWNAVEKDKQQYLSIYFRKGEAPASACPDAPMMVGPQPVSDFFIKSMSVASGIPTETPVVEETTAVPATLPETVATLPPTSAPTPVPTPTTTPGFGLITAVLGCVVTLAVLRR